VSASAAALDVSGAQNTSYTGNMFNSQSTTCVSFAGTNTGSVFDETNVVCISGALGGMNNINNTTAGTLVTQYGTAPPTVLTHQVGDKVINTSTSVGAPLAWTCSVAGIPGTWVASYALGALVSANLTAVTAINDTITYTTGGVTLASQIAAAGTAWRVKAFGTFVAVNSATARNAQVDPYWGTTALPAIAVAVLASVGQTTEWEVEFTLSGSSTTAIWTVGKLANKLDSPAIVPGTSAPMEIDNVTPASTTVTAGAQTLDLRFSMSVAVATDIWNVHGVTIERLT
jgi:hypothetical protein